MSPRIVIVGGGSYHWAPRLLCDFANTSSLAGAEVVLHDLDADRLKLMEELGGEIARRRGMARRSTRAAGMWAMSLAAASRRS